MRRVFGVVGGVGSVDICEVVEKESWGIFLINFVCFFVVEWILTCEGLIRWCFLEVGLMLGCELELLVAIFLDLIWVDFAGALNIHFGCGNQGQGGLMWARFNVGNGNGIVG